MSITVMFVCLGNICRSPTAHALFAARVKARGLQDHIDVCSSGTGDWHVGEPPDRRSAQVALDRGIDISHLRASQVSASDFQRCDYILAMDRQNLSDLQAMAPADYSGTLALFLDYDPEQERAEVPDPYYGGEEGFRLVIELIERTADALLDHILLQHPELVSAD